MNEHVELSNTDPLNRLKFPKLKARLRHQIVILYFMALKIVRLLALIKKKERHCNNNNIIKITIFFLLVGQQRQIIQWHNGEFNLGPSVFYRLFICAITI